MCVGGAALLRLLYCCDIPKEAKIDKSVEFPHHALGVVITPSAIIEENVIIQHHVTIGISKEGQTPIIRKGAYIGAFRQGIPRKAILSPMCSCHGKR